MVEVRLKGDFLSQELQREKERSAKYAHQIYLQQDKIRKKEAQIDQLSRKQREMMDEISKKEKQIFEQEKTRRNLKSNLASAKRYMQEMRETHKVEIQR
jgi:predicted  nucleic acid-binding Zn-ribbon protein